MGDRANVKMKQEGVETAVFLYTHWSGESLSHTVQRALSKQARWDDGPYLARIIFDCMTESEHGTETGYGISASIEDNEHPVLTVSTEDQQVWLENEDGTMIEGTTRTFPAFVAATYEAIQAWWQVHFKRR